MKIKNLLRIIKEAQQREAHLEKLDSRISGYINERGRLIYDPENCEKELKKAQEDYDKWIETELDFSSTKGADIDDDTHATNMFILDELKEYLDKHPKVRFGQALMNMGILQWSIDFDNDRTSLKDPFYDTPESILKRIRSNEGKDRE